MEWVLIAASILSALIASGLRVWIIAAADEPMIGGDVIEQPARPTAKPIPKDIREEIDQAPAWWDREFHKELARLQPKVEVDTGEDVFYEELTFMNGGSRVYEVPKPYEYMGCTCGDCKSARRQRR